MAKKLSEQDLFDLFQQNLPPVTMPTGLAEGIQQRVMAEVDATLKPVHGDVSEAEPIHSLDADGVLPRAKVGQATGQRRSRHGRRPVGQVNRLAAWFSNLRLGSSLLFTAATAAVLVLALILLPQLLGNVTDRDTIQTGSAPTVLTPVDAGNGPIQGTITVSGGSVTIVDADGTVDRYAGAARTTFTSGDTIITGSGSASLRFFDQQVTTLEPQTEVSVLTLNNANGGTQVVLHVAMGATHHVIERELTGQDKFEVRADALTATVIGTVFDVDVFSADTAYVETMSGRVLLRTRDDQWVDVEQGQSVNVSIGTRLVVNNVVDGNTSVASNGIDQLTPTVTPTAPAAPTRTADATGPIPKTIGTATATNGATGTIQTPSATPAAVVLATYQPTKPTANSGVQSSEPALVASTTGTATAAGISAATITPTATKIVLPTVTKTPQATSTGTVTSTPKPTATPTATATSRPSITPSRTRTPLPVAANTAQPKATSTPIPVATSTLRPTATRTSAPTLTSTSTNMPTATSVPTATPTETSTTTTTVTPTFVPTNTPTPVNLAPEVQNEIGIAVVEDMPKTVPVAVNDRDPEGQAVTVVSVEDGLFGKVTLNTDNSVTYAPAANYVGPDSFSYVVSDGVQTAIGTVTVNVTAVNDPPTFSLKSDRLTLEEDAGKQRIEGWAYNMSPGPANESDQSLVFAVEVNGAIPFAEAPSMDAESGVLSFTVAPDANGSATVSTRLLDSVGGSSEIQSFTIVVVPANDTPTFDLIVSEVNGVEDSGEQSIAVIRNINPGAANESAQTLSFETTTESPELFSMQPTIDSASGVMSFTPAPEASGRAVVSITLRDSGGASSTSQEITIVIAAVNDPPQTGADAFTVDEDSEVFGNLLVENGSSADIDPEGSDLKIVRVRGDEANVGAPLSLPSGALLTVGNNGDVRYETNRRFNELAAGSSFEDGFTYTVQDADGGTAVGTVTIVVEGENDPPEAQDDRFTMSANAVLSGNLLNDNGNKADFDLDTGDSIEISTVTVTENGQPIELNTEYLLSSGSRLSVRADGNFMYDAQDQVVSSETVPFTFSYMLIDGNGANSNVATVTIEVN